MPKNKSSCALQMEQMLVCWFVWKTISVILSDIHASGSLRCSKPYKYGPYWGHMPPSAGSTCWRGGSAMQGGLQLLVLLQPGVLLPAGCLGRQKSTCTSFALDCQRWGSLGAWVAFSWWKPHSSLFHAYRHIWQLALTRNAASTLFRFPFLGHVPTSCHGQQRWAIQPPFPSESGHSLGSKSLPPIPPQRGETAVSPSSQPSLQYRCPWDWERRWDVSFALKVRSKNKW